MSPSRTALSAKCEFTVHRERSKSLFSSINRYRASKKVPALTWDDTLYSYCVLHNIDMHASAVKSSNFSLGHGYNENVAHVPGSSKKVLEKVLERVLDLWNSRNMEKDNLLCITTKYSAIAFCSGENECYATQIFMEQRPKKNDKVVSMKTQKKCDTCKSGKTIASQGISSDGLKAKSVASTRLRATNSLSLVRKGASSKRRSTRSFFEVTGPKTNQPLLKNGGSMGQSIRNTIASGMNSLGEALDNILPSTNAEPRGKRPARRTERVAREGRSGPLMLSSNSLPCTFDRGLRPGLPARRPSLIRNGFYFEKCPFCVNRMTRKTEFCDACSTYM